MAEVRFAIISDLHLGDPREEMLWRNERTNRKNYLDEFCEFLAKEKINADCLVVPGDLTNKGDKDSFHEFNSVAERIRKALAVPKEGCIILPGNHDKNWLLANQAKNLPISDRLEIAYEPFETALSSMLSGSQACTRAYSREPFVKSWSNQQLYFLGLNSAAEDFPEDATHNGGTTRSSLTKIRSILDEEQERHAGRYKVLVTHHHPRQYSDIVSERWPDYSIMQNAEGLLHLLHEYEFDFFVHGHKHIPFFEITANELCKPLVCVCAGSFSAKLGPQYSGVASNSFHLLEIDGRNQHGLACGNLKSWAYLTGHGWRPSQANISGIEPRLSFGAWQRTSDLLALLEEAIVSEMAVQPHARWSAIETIKPELRYIPHRTKKLIFRQICDHLGLITVHHENDIVFLKEGV